MNVFIYRLSVLPLLFATGMLGACETMKPKSGGVFKESGQAIEITGGIIDGNAASSPMPMLLSDERVTVYSLDGPVQNPLSVERYTSVIENTTSGGYTVFDESVKVFPLPGDPLPAVVPPYAVAPFGDMPKAPTVGQPLSLTQASSLPPVPVVNVGNADPYANPPVSGAVRGPMLTQDYAEAPVTDAAGAAPMTAAGAPAGAPAVSAGRKSSPLLTGY